MSSPSLSVIVASSGRRTLAATLASITDQTREGDEILISVNTDCPWGHKARNQLMPAARGDALMFMDDDDTYLPGALDLARDAISAVPDRVHLFRMRYASGRELWTDEQVRCGNVSTQMVIAPNIPGRLGRWGDVYEGDFAFIESTCQLAGAPIWHPDTIALIRPS